MQKLNAVNLKNQLWETLTKVKSGKMDPSSADAVASQSREILRTTKIQLNILTYANKKVTKDLLEFVECE